MKKGIIKLATFKNRALVAGGAVAGAASSAMAAGEPLDLTATGTTLAGYVAGAATAGLGVAVAIWGVKVILRAFKSVFRA